MHDVSLRGHEVSEALPPFFAALNTERLPPLGFTQGFGLLDHSQ